MPRQTSKRLKGQKQVNPQATFDFTVPKRHGAARPVDPYEKPALDSKLTGIIKFVDQFSATSQQVVQANEIYKGVQREKGAEAARKGEEVSDKHWAFMEGYENLNGEVGAGEYKLKADAIIAKSEDMTPQEFRASMDGIFTEHINGRSDAYIKGFFPKALRAEEQAESSYLNLQRAKFTRENNKKLGSKFAGDLALLYSADSELSYTEKAAEMHAQLVKEQEFAVQHKIGSKYDVTKVFKDTVINKAILSGNPALLDVFTVADKHGIRLMDVGEYSKEISRAKVATEKAVAANDKAAQDARKAAVIEASNAAQRALSDSIVSGDRLQAKSILETYRDILPPAIYDKFLGEIDKGAGTETFGKFTDADVQRNLFNKAVNGQLNSEDFRLNRHLLTKDAYIELGEVNARGRKSAASSNRKPKHMVLVDEYKKYLKPLAAGDTTFELYGSAEHKRIADSMYILNRRVASKIEKNGGSSVDDEWLYKQINEIAKLVNGGSLPKPKEPEQKTDMHYLAPSHEVTGSEDKKDGLTNIGTRS